MAGRNTDGDQQVSAFFLFGNDGPITDGVRFLDATSYIAFIPNESISIDVALHHMGIHGVSRHADRVVCHPQPFAIMLGDYIIAYHASGFTDIQLLLPSVFTPIFILTCYPSRNLVPNLFWYTGVVDRQSVV